MATISSASSGRAGLRRGCLDPVMIDSVHLPWVPALERRPAVLETLKNIRQAKQGNNRIAPALPASRLRSGDDRHAPMR
jgi:hypothetical protein